MAKPDQLPEWAVSGSAQKIDDASPIQKSIGYDDGDFPNIGEFNWFFNLCYQWFQYINDELSVESDSSKAELANISPSWIYISVGDYNLIPGTPPVNTKIDRKISQLKEDVDVSISNSINSLSLNTVGQITGFNIKTDQKSATVLGGGGVVDLKRFDDTVWDPNKVIQIREPNTSSVSSAFVNVAFTDWSYFTASGMMATGVVSYGEGVSVYIFIVSHIGASGYTFMSDTNISGFNINTTYKLANNLSGSEDVYLRRLGATVMLTDNVTGNVIALEAYNKGDRFFCRNDALPGGTNTFFGKKIYFDNAGTFIPTTGAFIAQTILTNFATDKIAPILAADGVYHTDIHFSGVDSAFSTIQVSEVVNTIPMNRPYSIGNEETYAASGVFLTKCGKVSVDFSSRSPSITNIDTNIEYIDITMRGWTDSRDQYALV